MHRSKLDKTLNLLGDAIFGVTFIKKDGTVRKMSCRKRVGKYVKGVNPGGSAKLDNPQITVFQMVGKTGAEQYRSISLDTITSVRCYGIEAKVIPDPITVVADCSTDYSQAELKLA